MPKAWEIESLKITSNVSKWLQRFQTMQSNKTFGHIALILFLWRRKKIFPSALHHFFYSLCEWCDSEGEVGEGAKGGEEGFWVRHLLLHLTWKSESYK